MTLGWVPVAGELAQRETRATGRNSDVMRFLLGLACLVVVEVASGSEATHGSQYEPARTTWDIPDIGGTWDFRTLTPLERPQGIEKSVLTPEEAAAYRERKLRDLNVDSRLAEARDDIEGAYNTFWYDWGSDVNADLRTSLIVDPSDGRLPPVLPSARTELEERTRLKTPPVRNLTSTAADLPENPESLGLSDRCLVGFNAGPPLTPSAYNNNLRIVQTPDYTVLVTEMIHDARIVPMDGRPHLPSAISRWSGDSRGHWDGNTLVIETTNFTEKRPVFQLPSASANLSASGGVGSGRSLHLTERFTPVAEGRLLYEYTVEDPLTFESPFTVQIPLRASKGRMYEYACHEGNYAVPNILRGARMIESESR